MPVINLQNIVCSSLSYDRMSSVEDALAILEIRYTGLRYLSRRPLVLVLTQSNPTLCPVEHIQFHPVLTSSRSNNKATGCIKYTLCTSNNKTP